MPVTRIDVEIPGEKTYSVRVGELQLDSLGRRLKGAGPVSHSPSILLLTDSNVAPLYAESAKESLEGSGYKVHQVTVPAGESSKSVDVASEIWQAMAELGISRDCALVALGGGVVGDLGGFAAATFMRGIPVIQVPTTLLSMVDSSVGGKTGINIPQGKNLVGSFLQPFYVCASTDTLSTLPEREWACGLGEVAKSAAIDSDDFFFWVMENASALAGRETDAVDEAICRCIVFKASVVAQDKTESRGVRECLNYGHTLAHAIESLSGYGTYSHGAAVAEGMRFAAFLGQRMGVTSSEFAQAQSDLLDTLGLAPLGWNAPVDEVIECMKRDKKVRDGHLRFVILRDVSDWEILDVEDEIAADALSEYFDRAANFSPLD